MYKGVNKNWNKNLLFILIFQFLLISCSRKMYYKYRNTNYESPEQAFTSQRDYFTKILSKISETTIPIRKSAVVILPSEDYIKKNFVVHHGKMSQKAKEKSTNYIVQLIMNEYRCVADAIEKRRIFDNVSITISDDPQIASFDEDIAIVLFKNTTGESQWFLKRSQDYPERLIPLENITTALPDAQRMILRLNKIEEAARSK